MSVVPRGEVWVIPMWAAWRSSRVCVARSFASIAAPVVVASTARRCRATRASAAWVAQHQVPTGVVSVIPCSSRRTWATQSWWVASV